MVSTTLQNSGRADTPANTECVMRTGHLGPHLLQVLRDPAHHHWTIPWAIVGDAGNLEPLGFYKSIGMNRALSHWRLELPDGQEIHVQEQVGDYEVHWDYVSLRRDPIGHGIRDAPGLTVGLVLLAAAVFGAGGSA